MKQTIRSIRRKYISLALLLLAISIVFRVSFDTVFINKLLDEKIITLDFQLHTFYNDKLDSLNNKYKTISKIFSSDSFMYTYFQKNDRKRMYDKFLPFYKLLKKEDPFLYVMQFNNTRNIVFLRMHKPSEYGDDGSKKRPLVKYVNETKTTQYGFEVGHNGINYRIATPIIDAKKEHFGVLEFGLDPSLFTKEINKRFGAQAVVLVKNSALANLNKPMHLQKVGNYSILQQAPLFETLLPQIDLSKEHQILQHKGLTYLVHMDLSLYDYNGDSISKIIVIQDISDYITENRKMLYQADTINLIALLLIAFIIYFVLSKYAKELHTLEFNNKLLFKKAEKFKDKSFTDNLTRLHNREYLEHFCKQNKQIFENKRGVCAIFDIDYFKIINDTHGHQAGDEVLKELSRLMKQFFRRTDALIRYGGEEFLIILGGMEYKAGCEKMELFRQAVEKTDFPQELQVTVSIGVTQILTEDTVQSMVARADAILYKAKESGRNQTVCSNDQNP